MIYLLFTILTALVMSHLNLSHMYRLKDVQTLEELGDVYNHFLLYYGRDIPKMQNAAKASKKRLKKIKEVSEDGKMHVSDRFISLDDDGSLNRDSCFNYLLHD